MKNKELVDRLRHEWNYSTYGANLIAEKLQALCPDVAWAFEQWSQVGSVPDLEVEGYTYKFFVEEDGLKPVAAFLTLDWLSREPEEAKAAIRRGRDWVGRPQDSREAFPPAGGRPK